MSILDEIERRFKLREHRSLSWSLTTEATTADQKIGSHKPTTRSNFVVQTVFIVVYLTTMDTTAKLLGTLTIYFPDYGEYILKDCPVSNTSSGALCGFPIEVPEGWFEKHYQSEIKAVCTPAVATQMKWIVQILGYDK